MLNAFFLLIIIIGLSVQNVAKKPYTEKTGGNGVYFFSAMGSLFALIFFLITSNNLSFNTSIVLYSVAFALFYALAIVFNVMAISCGSLSLTSLFISYSLMVPTFYGLFFLKDPVSIGLIPGIILLIISLILINKNTEQTGITPKWIVYIIIAFIGNGMCSVVQKMQQEVSGGKYKNEFMIIALTIVTAVMLTLSLIKERKDIQFYFKSGWHLAILCGVMNGIVNLFVMIATGKMPVSFVFPMISAGGIILTYIVSRFLYKEKLSKLQFIGFITGIVSVVFLNI